MIVGSYIKQLGKVSTTLQEYDEEFCFRKMSKLYLTVEDVMEDPIYSKI